MQIRALENMHRKKKEGSYVLGVRDFMCVVERGCELPFNG